MKQIQHVAVIGAGAMGSQIAVLAALAGCETAIIDIDQDRLDASIEKVRSTVHRQVERGTLEAADVDKAFARLTTSTNLEAAVHGADIVIEAIIENLEAKRELFSQLGQLTRSDTILATNSSSIVSSKLAEIPHPERVCNMHFFNPALVMKLVEVVGGDHTSNETVDRAFEMAKRMGKNPVVVRKEIFGFIANRIIASIFDEAIFLYETGIASFEEIDAAVTDGLGHPIGPFALLDLTGIDVNVGIKNLEAQETGDPSRGPSTTLLELYKQGKLGRKTGSGFYEYGEK